MKQRWTGILLLVATSSGWADCVEVSRQQIKPLPSETSSPAVQWEAEVKNICDAEFDAALTVHFLDAGNGDIYEVRDLVTLNIGETRKVGKKVYVPSETASKVKKITVQVEERKLPL